MDLKSLTNDQKRIIGELFGENTVKQIIPDGSKLARLQGTGTTGIDDLYKVNRSDVDYVVIEYKFNKSGLGDPLDGKQGSESWIMGSNRLEKAVGVDMALDVRRAVNNGRTETWVVRTMPDGRTKVQVLDANGNTKNIDTSAILGSIPNLSGAQP